MDYSRAGERDQHAVSPRAPQCGCAGSPPRPFGRREAPRSQEHRPGVGTLRHSSLAAL